MKQRVWGLAMTVAMVAGAWASPAVLGAAAVAAMVGLGVGFATVVGLGVARLTEFVMPVPRRIEPACAR